jgi:hypothetical protein
MYRHLDWKDKVIGTGFALVHHVRAALPIKVHRSRSILLQASTSKTLLHFRKIVLGTVKQTFPPLDKGLRYNACDC